MKQYALIFVCIFTAFYSPVSGATETPETIVLLREELKHDESAEAIAAANSPFKFERASLENLDLNRQGRKLSKAMRRGLHGAHTGFLWNLGDNCTLKWRPQGITGMKAGEKKFLAVSWYGRAKHSYENRGARVSFVDVTDMDKIKYRHVLLVDEEYNTFEGTHAGGLAYCNSRLHVPETTGGKKEINVFNIEDIEAVPKKNHKDYYNYGYILRRESVYEVSITPSFISYNKANDEFLTGSFDKEKADNLQWYSLAKGEALTCGPFVKKMQGAAVSGEILWIATSYGRTSKSTLYGTRYIPGEAPDSDKFKTWKYPAGLEDLHISASGNLWMLTEFGPLENPACDRIVFATKLEKLQP